MAKIKIDGDVLTITSEVTKEVFDKVRRFSPETLKIKDADGNEFFRVDFNDQCRHEVSEFGIVFHSVNANGKMFLTTMNIVQGVHDDLEAERKMITDRYANIIVKINAVEAAINEELNIINGISDAVQDSIEIAGE